MHTRKGDPMFGRRPDGRRVAQNDAIVAFAPYLMPTRVDAQVHSVQRIDCDILTKYIQQQRGEGQVLSYLDLIVSGYVRTISQHPELNRFLMNKQFYARNCISISLAILKNLENSDEIQESIVKVYFRPDDTVYDVRDALQKAIEDNRRPETKNSSDYVARFLMAVPGLPTCIAGLARLLDRYGLLPRVLIDASPFHTGLFITNMMSLGMPYVNHHVYNFGNTSIFISLGKVERQVEGGPGGALRYRRIIPVGVVNDERIASGAEFGRAFTLWRDLLADPARLETPPETVKADFPAERMPRAPGGKKNRALSA